MRTSWCSDIFGLIGLRNNVSERNETRTLRQPRAAPAHREGCKRYHHLNLGDDTPVQKTTYSTYSPNASRGVSPTSPRVTLCTTASTICGIRLSPPAAALASCA